MFERAVYVERNDNLEKQWTFRDGERSIDYVLVWSDSLEKSGSSNMQKRAVFENNLREEGLELEHDIVEDLGLNFVKIHAPDEVLKRYAEIIQLRLPLKVDTMMDTASIDYRANDSSWWRCLTCCFQVDKEVFPDVENKLTAPYSRAKSFLFNSNDPEFFRPIEKARMVLFILQRTLHTSKASSDVFEYGIDRLLLNHVYLAAYPLHDGDLDTPDSMRNKLYTHWATLSNWYSYQPLDHIRQYYGVKIAIYFAWLGFYTNMLFPASVVGIACIIGSVYLLPTDETFNEICSGAIRDPMCPLCDYYCDFWASGNTCFNSKISFLFDNYSTVFFAVFMSFWSVTFLSLWKRYSSQITFHWDLTWLDDQNELPRAEYAAKLNSLLKQQKITTKLNVVTNAYEPALSYWGRIFPAKALSFVTISFLVVLAIAGVIGVTVYRMIAVAVVSSYKSKITTVAILLTSLSATSLNLACIFIFSGIYGYLAKWLTKMELPRTQREFDSSLTMKLYVLEFINNYSSIFFIAFFKGKYIGTPNHYIRIFGFRQVECGPGGCMWELTVQLAFIMIGKRALKSLIEYVRPILKVQIRKLSWGVPADQTDTSQCQKDYFLVEAGPQVLIPDYLDMVLQYGFLTIFASAFPLAPLFAFFNNIFEIRIDAKNLLALHRRPCTQRVKGIGVWYEILDAVSWLAVFTNGIIIAFTSSFIPKLVYRYSGSPDRSLRGYLNHTLSYMSIADLDMHGKPETTYQYCRYFDYKEPPWSENKYEETKMYWHVLAARLVFFAVFENLIMVCRFLLNWLIPDVPGHVRLYMRRRNHLLNETIIKQEISQPSYQRTRTVQAFMDENLPKSVTKQGI